MSLSVRAEPQGSCACLAQFKIQASLDFAYAEDFVVLIRLQDQFPIGGDEQAGKFMFRFHTLMYVATHRKVMSFLVGTLLGYCCL
jgi:hypothetical protein